MVSGTGGRTIKSSAALALVVGLALAAAPPTHAAATPAEEEPTPTATTEPTEQEDAEPEPETTGTATQPPPPETDPVTDPEDDATEGGDDDGDGDGAGEDDGDPDQGQPGDSETDEGDPDQGQPGDSETDEGDPDQGQPGDGETDEGDPDEGQPGDDQTDEGEQEEPTQGPAQSGLSCEGAGVNPGETVTVTCTAAQGSTLELGSTNSAIGGAVEISGFDITYTAPSAVDGTPSDPFTVIATDPEGSTTSTQVAFSVYGTVNGDDGAEPTQSLPPVPPDATEESTPAPTETAAAAPPGTPTGGGLPNLPIPGLPASPWDNLPTETEEPEAGSHTTHQSDDEKAEDTETDDPEDLLAQTGPEQAAWAGSLAIASILLGAAALRMSRRCTQ